MKTNKSSKAEVDAQVAILLDLKKQLTSAGGEVANNKGKDDKKKQKQPPQAKVAPPKEPTPAPTGPVLANYRLIDWLIRLFIHSFIKLVNILSFIENYHSLKRRWTKPKLLG